jgi:glycyl-tRNA synthetase beta chain
VSEVRDLLIEIGTEELPPRALKSLSEAFEQAVTQGLADHDLKAEEVHAYAAPRRLALWLEAVPLGQPDQQIQKRGPAVVAAFDDDGNPTPAASGFARSCGVEVSELEQLETDKGAWLAYTQHQPGKSTANLLPEVVRQALQKLPIPKRMRWGDGEAEFVRPVHWVVMLQGDELVETEILGIQSGRYTRGHRFHHPEQMLIAEPAAYAPMLETEGHVLAEFDARKAAIKGQVIETAESLGGQAVIDEDLLDEVTALVEWPVAVAGGFEERFLDVPQESLISTMQDHQKYFPVVDNQGRLMPWFITISNIESSDVQKVREGNERVIRPRFSDSEFFWNQDRKQGLAAFADELPKVVFQKDLGSLADKTARISRLAAFIAAETGTDTMLAERAAFLSRCDLMSSMVYEFPELQGIMGRYYATHDQEPGDVAQALDEFYMPRHAGDELPSTGSGRAIALADRIDTLVGIFAIGQKPTGTKDPFALRRAALGVLRIIIECGLELDLLQLLHQAAEGLNVFVQVSDESIEETFEYCLERLRAYYQDQGIPLTVFDSVMVLRPPRPLDFDQRVKAVEAFRQLDEAESLAAANKRSGNILKKLEGAVPDTLNSDLLQEEAEQNLALEMDRVRAVVEPLFDEGQYRQGLEQLAVLRNAVDRFFDEVMVMADDEDLRNNRLALLGQLRAMFLRAADLSRLQQ